MKVDTKPARKSSRCNYKFLIVPSSVSVNDAQTRRHRWPHGNQRQYAFSTLLCDHHQQKQVFGVCGRRGGPSATEKPRWSRRRARIRLWDGPQPSRLRQCRDAAGCALSTLPAARVMAWRNPSRIFRAADRLGLRMASSLSRASGVSSLSRYARASCELAPITPGAQPCLAPGRSHVSTACGLLCGRSTGVAVARADTDLDTVG